MSDSLIEDFERFYDALPSTVRNDLSFMMVMLSDENLLVQDVGVVYENAAQGLFNTRTRIGRIGDLINAVSIFDVYFALDARTRFSPEGSRRQRQPAVGRNGGLASIRDKYAGRITDLQAAKRQWMALRRTKFAPEAIARALIPPTPSKRRDREGDPPSTARERKPGDPAHAAISQP
jgi:hypothetical protein